MGKFSKDEITEMLHELYISKVAKQFNPFIEQLKSGRLEMNKTRKNIISKYGFRKELLFRTKEAMLYQRTDYFTGKEVMRILEYHMKKLKDEWHYLKYKIYGDILN